MSRLVTEFATLPLWFWPSWFCSWTIVGLSTAVEKFGINVRAAREAHGWTQEELSHRSGLSTVQISRIERGVREVRLTTVVRLLDALDIAADILFADVRAG